MILHRIYIDNVNSFAEMFLSHVSTHVRCALGAMCAITTIEPAFLNEKIRQRLAGSFADVSSSKTEYNLEQMRKRRLVREIVASLQFKLKEISNATRNYQSDHLERKYTYHRSHQRDQKTKKTLRS